MSIQTHHIDTKCIYVFLPFAVVVVFSFFFFSSSLKLYQFTLICSTVGVGNPNRYSTVLIQRI